MDNALMRRGAVLFITLSMCAAPLLASAQTTTTTDASSTAVAGLRSQIQTLMTQVNSLRQQIAQITGVAEPDNAGNPDTATSTPPVHHPGELCLGINRTLQVGAQGTDVKQLQQFLAQDPSIFNGTATGFFGAKTAQAVQRFQAVNGIASSTTGTVGPRTREFLNGACVNGQMGTSTPARIGDGQMMPPIPNLRVGSTTLPALIHDMGLSSSTLQRIWEVASSTLGGFRPGDFFNGSTTVHGGPMIPVPPPAATTTVQR